MSVPLMAIGIASAWIGNGLMMPSLARASVISGITPRSVKVCRFSTSGAVSSSRAISVSVVPHLQLRVDAARAAGG
jgi:hypothetical protein